MAYNQTSWQFGISTHTGPVKKVNEDHPFFRVTKDSRGGEIAIAAVADGMGGYLVGDLASQMAIDMVSEWWDKRIEKILKQRDPLEQVLSEQSQLIFKINKTLFNIRRNKGIKLGTTLSVLVLYKGEFSIIHIGDSRIYKLTGSRLAFQNFFRHQLQGGNVSDQVTELLEEPSEINQLTEDHSWVNMHVRAGKMTKEEARIHEKRNVLTQCLGIKEGVEVFQIRGEYQPNDIFLLCSDGFYSCFSDETIQGMLKNFEEKSDNLQMVSEHLVRMAHQNGSTDNITAVLIRNMFVKTQTPRSQGWMGFLWGNRNMK